METEANQTREFQHSERFCLQGRLARLDEAAEFESVISTHQEMLSFSGWVTTREDKTAAVFERNLEGTPSSKQYGGQPSATEGRGSKAA